jgi:hypothetical protein
VSRAAFAYADEDEDEDEDGYGDADGECRELGTAPSARLGSTAQTFLVGLSPPGRFDVPAAACAASVG